MFLVAVVIVALCAFGIVGMQGYTNWRINSARDRAIDRMIAHGVIDADEAEALR